MATVLAQADLVKISAWVTHGGQASVNTLWWLVTGATPTATDQDVATAFDTTLAPLYKAVLNDNASYRGIVAQILRLTPTRILFADVFAVGNTGVGTAGAISLPTQTSGLVGFYSNLAGRKYRGRWYISFPASADDSGTGYPQASYLSRVSAIAAGILGISMISSGGRTAAGVPSLVNRTTYATTPITTYSTRLNWATQRRRSAFGRANSSPI